MLLTHIQPHFPRSDEENELCHPRLVNTGGEKNHITIGDPRRLSNSPRDFPLIPYEIICRIFQEYRDLDAGGPTIISHICRSWRQIALSRCGLWTNIELGRRETTMDRASVWVARARGLPVSLGIRYSEHTDAGAIIAWLKGKADQIKSVTILHLNQSEGNDLLTSLPPLKHIESLQIVGVEEIYLDLTWIAQLLAGSPRLSSLAWSGVGGLHFHESLAKTAGQITHLSIAANSYIDYAFPLPVNAVLAVISACVGLTYLECHALGEEDDIAPRTVYLPSLSSLTIGDGPETCLVLKYLHAPKLRTLRLVRGSSLNEKEEVVEMPQMKFNRDGYMDLFVDCIRCLHQTCSPPLTRVVWDRAIIDIDVLRQCVPYLRGMEELRCYGIGDIPISLLAMVTEMTHRPFPCLRRVVFTKCTIKAEWLNTIQTLTKEKGVAHSCPIEQLIVEDCPGASDIYFRQT